MNSIRSDIDFVRRLKGTYDSDCEDYYHALDRLLAQLDLVYPKEQTQQNQWSVAPFDYSIYCLHDNCPSCGGSGQKKDGAGPCVHMMSCTCSKCSVQC